MVVDQLSDHEVDRLFHALADATRRDIVRRVIDGEYSISDLARLYPMSMTAVQKHVSVLEEAGLVAKQRRGREQRVLGRVEALQEAQRLLGEFERLWRDRFDRMSDLLAQTKGEKHVTVTNVHKDTDQLTMTITAELAAPIERAWQLWGDPRQLERWWGPPTYPATFVDHDLTPGGTVSYFMTGPEGDQHHGWWRILEVDVPRRISLEDGFSDDSGKPVEGMPVMAMVVTFGESSGGGSSMSIKTTFPSLEAMEQMVAMGMDEGLKEAMGQIDAILAE